jgi:hypothetical protein
MTVKSVLEDTKKFLGHLGLSEEPFGVYYDNTKPEKRLSSIFPASWATSGWQEKSIAPPTFPRKNMDAPEACSTVP